MNSLTKCRKLITLVGFSAIAALIATGSSTAIAASHQHHENSGTTSPPVHGPGSSHHPIVYHPVHGPGSSHNPKVKTGSGKKNCIARGTVVHDHRNGKDCSYVSGDSRSFNQYRQCEGIHSGGAVPWC